MKITISGEVNGKGFQFKIHPVIAVLALAVLFALLVNGLAHAGDPGEPLTSVVDRPIEFSDMTATNPVPPVDLDQLETDLLEHGWEPSKVHDIMQDLRSGQMRYDAMCDDWREP